MKKYYIIEYLNSKKNFQKDFIEFEGPNAYEQAIYWGKKNLDNFQRDHLKQ